MTQVFTKSGVAALRTQIVLLVVAIAAGAGIVVGSRFFADKERRESADAGQRLQEAQRRLDSAKRERDLLAQSSEVFRALTERGLLQGEHRMDLVELVNILRSRHQLGRSTFRCSS